MQGVGLEGPLQWLQLLEITPAPGGSFILTESGKRTVLFAPAAYEWP